MDFKKEHDSNAGCLRAAVTPRCGLRSIQASAPLGHRLKRSNVMHSTTRKWVHAEKKKRTPSITLARLVKASQGAMEISPKNTKATRGFMVWPSPPPGAMAPANTTQYLMKQAYEDSQREAAILGLSTFQHPGEEELTCVHEARMSFQLRDFEEQFGGLWGDCEPE